MDHQINQDERVPGIMHPTDEEIMEFLYEETPAHLAAHLTAHLAQCPDCAGKVGHWRKTMTSLNRWEISSAPVKARPWSQPWIKWAAAAAIILSAGYLSGRLLSTQARPGQLREAVEKAVREQWAADFKSETDAAIRREVQEVAQTQREDMARLAEVVAAAASSQSRRLLAEFLQTSDQRRARDYEIIRDQILGIESRRSKEYQHLRSDLETVAILTETGLRRAQDGIVTLASLAQGPTGDENLKP